MRLLNSIDLFTGVGGFTRALHDVAKPLLYCEIDPFCQLVLESRMEDGSIPRAPLIKDVRNVNIASVKLDPGQKVDIIVAGWPCQDLSTLGLQKGLDGARSGLIREVFRITDLFNPNLIFLENVPMILKNGIDRVIQSFVTQRGYQMRWAVVPAAFTGAPHLRRRWFCLLVKDDREMLLQKVNVLEQSSNASKINSINTIKGYQWYRKWTHRVHTHIPRMYHPRNAFDKKNGIARVSSMGNSVVPDCVRTAFMILAEGFYMGQQQGKPTHSMIRSQKQIMMRTLTHAICPILNNKTRIVYKIDKDTLDSIQDSEWGWILPKSMQSSGCMGCIMSSTRKEDGTFKPPNNDKKFLIQMHPRVYNGEPVHPVTRPLITKLVSFKGWSTPRHSSSISAVLTERTIRDLGTQLRFEIDTPDNVRSGDIHPHFTEWLMGYPVGWTRLSKECMQKYKAL